MERTDWLVNPELKVERTCFPIHLMLPKEVDALFPPLLQSGVRFAERVVLDHFVDVDQSSAGCAKEAPSNPIGLTTELSMIHTAKQGIRSKPGINPITVHPHDPLRAFFPSWLSTSP